MKIILKENTQRELERINNLYGDESSPKYDEWDEMSEQEILIADAGMYANEAYIKNEFDDLDEWCQEVGPLEYEETYLRKYPFAVRNKIDLMLSKDLIYIE